MTATLQTPTTAGSGRETKGAGSGGPGWLLLVRFSMLVNVFVRLKRFHIMGVSTTSYTPPHFMCEMFITDALRTGVGG